jgi:hypothetical protein
VSPSWRSARIRVHLSAGALAACEVQGRGRGARVLRKARISYEPGARGTALASLEWVLGASEARYLMLPWTPDLADPGFRDALAAALFEQQFRQDAALYAVRFAAPSYGHAQLAAFVPKELLAEIDAHASESRCRVWRIEPAVALVWARFRALLRKERGTLLLIDGERQLVVRHDGGQIGHLALRPFGVGMTAAPAGAGAGDEALRVFSSHPVDAAVAAPAASLVLADGSGFTAAKDADYTFALCGVF